MEDAIELQKRLFIESDVANVFDANAPFTQAIVNGMFGKAGIVLFAREAFLLGSSDDRTVAHETGRAVVVKSRNAEDVDLVGRADLLGCQTHLVVESLSYLSGAQLARLWRSENGALRPVQTDGFRPNWHILETGSLAVRR